MTTPSERQRILVQLHTLAVEDLVKLWRAASGMDLESQAFRALIEEAYPDIPARWGTAAAEFAAQWYDEAAPELAYRATPAPLHPVEQYAANANWALGAVGEAALDRLVADLQWSMFDMARTTTELNVESETGSRWARYASSTACAFCRVMASRGAVYSSAASATTVVGRGKEMSESDRRARARGETRDARHRFIAGGRRTRGSQEMRSSFHKSCRCIAVEVRPGGVYEPPAYVEKWQQDYIDASRAVSPGAGAGSLKDIVAHMRANTGAK